MEIRADGLHISGYVNVPGRQSRPLTNAKRGKFVETIEQRAFQRAIDRAGKIDLLVDHDKSRKVASTSNGTLKLHEDEIGLRAEAVTSDAGVMEAAEKGEIRGWSFNMFRITDQMEERADALPIRHVRDFDMSEVSLITKLNPCYDSTKVEVRAGEEVEIEERASEGNVKIMKPKKEVDYSKYKEIIKELKNR